MRIIGGQAKGIRLKSLKGLNTRPTSDRVKESIFNIIAPYIYNARVLDLFSGTGNLGIESISRGAKKAYLIEKNRKCIAIINDNITKTKFNDKIKIYIQDVISAIKLFGEKNEEFDIIFMDPPYLKNFVIPSLKEISKNNILSNNGIIIVEHDLKDDLPKKVENLEIFKEKKYGNTKISFYHKED